MDRQNGNNRWNTMADKRKALGRGLDALLPSSKTSAKPTPQLVRAESTSDGSPREIAIEQIDANPYQTRNIADETALQELAASIKVSGVLQPILVRSIANGKFQLMAGQRRMRASEIAGKKSIPAIVRTMSDQQAMETTIVENLQREDLNPIEQAQAFDRLAHEFKLTQDQIAQRTGKDRASITNYMRLLKLPSSVQQDISDGRLSMGHGKVLLALPLEHLEVSATDFARKAIEKGWNVRQLEEQVMRLRETQRPQKPKKEKLRDPNVRAIEERLQRTLGCKVEIKDMGKKGKITLYYDDLIMFDVIQDKLER